MGNQKFVGFSTGAITINGAASGTETFTSPDHLPISYFVKKVLLILENTTNALTKYMLFRWQLYTTDETRAFINDYYRSDGKLAYDGMLYGAGDLGNHVAVGLNAPSIEYVHTIVENGITVVEFRTNLYIKQNNKPLLDLLFNTIDSANGTNDAMDVAMIMECVVA